MTKKDVLNLKERDSIIYAVIYHNAYDDTISTIITTLLLEIKTKFSE